MTYTHLTTNELVMIEAYYQAGKRVCDISKSLGRSRQTIYNVLSFLKTGHSAYDYYERYRTNKKRCGRKNTQLTKPVQDFIQSYLELDWSLDVIKGTYPDNIPCSMRTLYRLADRGIFHKNDFPWQGKRNPNGKKETRGKQAFRRNIRERTEMYPAFESEFGHLEGDTIVGKNHKSAVITLVEKQSKAIITLQTNGRKQMDFNDISQNYLSAIADKRNRIPRKSLNYLTPYQVFLTNLKMSNLI